MKNQTLNNCRVKKKWNKIEKDNNKKEKTKLKEKEKINKDIYSNKEEIIKMPSDNSIKGGIITLKREVKICMKETREDTVEIKEDMVEIKEDMEEIKEETMEEIKEETMEEIKEETMEEIKEETMEIIISHLFNHKHTIQNQFINLNLNQLAIGL